MARKQIRLKVLRRFYEPLLLLGALDQVRGDRVKNALTAETEDSAVTSQRRAFADAIAFISAYKKGSDYITAAALESSKDGIVIWLAANGRVEDEVISFLCALCSTIQHMLESIQIDTVEYQKYLKMVTDQVLTFGFQRNLHYHSKITSTDLQPCFDLLARFASGFVSAASRLKNKAGPEVVRASAFFERFLKLKELLAAETSATPPTLNRIAFECHRLRKEGMITIFEYLAREHVHLAKRLHDLCDLLCKIAKHVTWTRRLLQACFSCKSDIKKGLSISVVPGSERQAFPLRPAEATVESTIDRIYTDESARDLFRRRLSFLNGSDELPKIMESQKKIETIVHAELLLVDHFEAYPHTFLDPRDRYIACSKPSCYLCYAYMNEHPGHYAVSNSHQKLYLHWRTPYAQEDKPNARKRNETQEKVLLKLIEKVRHDLEAEVKSAAAKRSAVPDSSIGTTTDQAQRCSSWVKALLNNQGSQSNDPSEAQDDVRSILSGLSISPDINRDAKDVESLSDDEQGESDGGVSLA